MDFDSDDFDYDDDGYFPGLKDDTRAQLQAAMVDYLARGGHVQELPHSASGLDRGYLKRSEADSMAKNNAHITKRAQARNNQLCELLRKELASGAPRDLADICRGSGASMAKMKDLLREHFADDPAAQRLASASRYGYYERADRPKTRGAYRHG